MEAISTIGLLMGVAWASGINLYATVIVLGISHNLGWVALPATLDPATSTPVIAVAVVLYICEFCADKIPAFDSFWDLVHTFVRPLGGAALAYMSVGTTTPEFQMIATMVGGALALEAHTFKATTRLAVNTSPEPVSNSIVSVTEDVAVVGIVAIALANPVLSAIVVTILLVGTIWLLYKLSQFLRMVIRKLFNFSKETNVEATNNNQPPTHA